MLEPLQLAAAVAISNEGLSQSPRAGKVIVGRVRALSSDPAEEVVLILAHGMADDLINDGLHRDIDRLADSVRALGPFRHVVVETLREDWQARRVVAENRIRDFVNQESAKGHRVIVIPFRVAGFGPYRKVLDGTDYVSDGLGLLPHREITSWIRDQIDRLLLPLGRPTGSNQ